jgi:anhydro-N-acetylmuramic acid kinase
MSTRFRNPRKPPRGAEPRVIVGLMSGTSLDGISAAVVRFDEHEGKLGAELLAYISHPYNPAQRAQLSAALIGVSPRDYTVLDFDLGAWLADAAVAVMAEAGVARDDIDAIASHGQTIWHEPARATWQMGNAAVIAERTGVSVISDFRSRDVAAGGQGAPLVTIADALLFASSDRWRGMLNLGGIGNLQIVPPNGVLESVRAFDTGPGVVIIDGVVRALTEHVIDEHGALARSGGVIASVVAQELAHPFFSAPPPKSTGRELFTPLYIQAFIAHCRAAKADSTTGDIVATAVALTARSIAMGFERFIAEPVTELLVSGGGARNPALLDAIREAMKPVVVSKFEDLYFDGDAKEAVAFAFLGWLHLEHRAGNVPNATGAAGPRILGSYTPA